MSHGPGAAMLGAAPLSAPAPADLLSKQRPDRTASAPRLAPGPENGAGRDAPPGTRGRRLQSGRHRISALDGTCGAIGSGFIETKRRISLPPRDSGDLKFVNLFCYKPGFADALPFFFFFERTSMIMDHYTQLETCISKVSCPTNGILFTVIDPIHVYSAMFSG